MKVVREDNGYYFDSQGNYILKTGATDYSNRNDVGASNNLNYRVITKRILVALV